MEKQKTNNVAKTEDRIDEMIDADISTIPSKFTFKLSKPVEVGNEKITEITVDFDRLDTYTVERIGRKFPENMGFLESNKAYLIEIIAAAANLNPHVIKSLCLSDGTALTMKAQVFLMASSAREN